MAAKTTGGFPNAFVSIELRYRVDASQSTTLIAPISNFMVTAVLQYAEASSDSFCLQRTVLNYCLPSNPGTCCRGSCSTDNISCSGPCQDTAVCSSQIVCAGQNGVAVCTNLQINRAGAYKLTFRFSACFPPLFEPNGCQQTTRAFTVAPLAEGVKFLSLGCRQCIGPKSSFNGQSLSAVVQALDNLGNSISDGTVSVMICSTPLCANPLPVQQFKDGIFTSDSSSSLSIAAALQGSLAVNLSGGFAFFTNMSIVIPFSSVRLVFRSGTRNVISAPFKILAREVFNIRLKQQPSVWGAGIPATFEIFVVDENGYVVEQDSSTIIVAELLGAALGAFYCVGGGAQCTTQRTQNGTATFHPFFTKSGPQYIVRFRTSNTFLDSAPFYIMNSAPSSIYILQQPTSVISGSTFALSPAVMLADRFGNLLTSQNLGGFDPNCESILQILWCDRQVCKGISAVGAGLCCTTSLTETMNNAFTCTGSTSGRYHPVKVDISCIGSQDSCRTPQLEGSVDMFKTGLIEFNDLVAHAIVETTAQLTFSANLTGVIARNVSNTFKITPVNAWLFTSFVPSTKTICLTAGMPFDGIASVIACRICTDIRECSLQTKEGRVLCPEESRIRTAVNVNVEWKSGTCLAANIQAENCNLQGSTQGICGPQGLCNFTDLRVGAAGLLILRFQPLRFASTLASSLICVSPSLPFGINILNGLQASYIAGEQISPAPTIAVVDKFGNTLRESPNCGTETCYAPPTFSITSRLVVHRNTAPFSFCSEGCGFQNQVLTVGRNGTVSFSTLSVAHASRTEEQYSLFFELNSTSAFLNTSSAPFVVVHDEIRRLSLQFIDGMVQTATAVAGRPFTLQASLTDQFGNLATCCCGMQSQSVSSNSSLYFLACNKSKYAVTSYSVISVITDMNGSSVYRNISGLTTLQFSGGLALHRLRMFVIGKQFHFVGCYTGSLPLIDNSCLLNSKSASFELTSNNGSKLVLSFSNSLKNIVSASVFTVSAGLNVVVNAELKDVWGNQVSDSMSTLLSYVEATVSDYNPYNAYVHPNSSIRIAIMHDLGCTCGNKCKLHLCGRAADQRDPEFQVDGSSCGLVSAAPSCSQEFPLVQLFKGSATFAVNIELAGNATLFSCPVSTVTDCSSCISAGLQQNNGLKELFVSSLTCGIFQGGNLLLKIVPENTSNVSMVAMHCNSQEYFDKVRIFEEMNCTFKLVERFGNQVSTENALQFTQGIRTIFADYMSNTTTFNSVLNSPKKVNMPLKWTLFTSFLAIQVERNQSNSVSPFNLPLKNRILMFYVVSDKSNFTAASLQFDVITGPVTHIALGQSLMSTAAGDPLVLDPSDYFLSIHLLDISNSLASDANSAFLVNFSYQQPNSTDTSANLTAVNGIIKVFSGDLLAPTEIGVYQLHIFVLSLHNSYTLATAQWRLSVQVTVVSNKPSSLHISEFPENVLAFEVFEPAPKITIYDKFQNIYSFDVDVRSKILSPASSRLQGSFISRYNASAGSSSFSNLIVNSLTHGSHEIMFFVCNLESQDCPSVYSRTVFFLKRIAKLQLVNQPGTAHSNHRRAQQFRTLNQLTLRVLDYDNNGVNGSRSEIYVRAFQENTQIRLLGRTSMPLNSLNETVFSNLSFETPGNNIMLVFYLDTSQNLTISTVSLNVEGIDVIHLNVSVDFGLNKNGSSSTSISAGQPFSVFVEILDFDFARKRSASDVVVYIGVHKVPNAIPSSDILNGVKMLYSVNGSAQFTNLSINIASPHLGNDCSPSDCLEASSFQLNVSCPFSNGYVLGVPDQVFTGTFIVEHGEPWKLVVGVQPSAIVSGDVMSPNPELYIQDLFGNIASRFYPADFFGQKSYFLAVNLQNQTNQPRNTTLVGTLDVNYPVLGIVRFTDLQVFGESYEEYKLVFALVLSISEINSTRIISTIASQFAVRSFTALIILNQPRDPCYFGEIIQPSPNIMAVDSAGRLAPSNFTVIVSSKLLNVSGLLSIQTERGTAVFSNIKLPQYNLATYTDGQRYSLIFSALKPGVNPISSDTFSLLQGVENDFRVSAQPAYLQAQNQPFKNIILQLRDGDGRLVMSGHSARVDLLLCSNCKSSSATSCICQVVNDRLYGDGLRDKDGQLILCSQASSGSIAFEQIVVAVPDDNYFLKFTRYKDVECNQLYPVEGLGRQFTYSSKIRVASFAPVRFLDLNLSSCPSDSSVFVAGESIKPQPQILGIFDSSNKPAFVLGSEIKALLYMLPEGVSQVACAPFDAAKIETRECFPFEGYKLKNRAAAVDAMTATATFQSLTIISSTDGIPDVSGSIVNRKFYLRLMVNSYVSPQGFIGNVAYSDCPHGFYVRSGSPSNLKILVQPADRVAGSYLDLSVRVVDSYENFLSGVNTTSIEAIIATNSSNNPRISWNQRYQGDDVSKRLLFLSEMYDGQATFGNDSVSIIRIFFSANRYYISVSTQISPENVLSVVSDAFDVVPSVLAGLVILPAQMISVAVNDSICGSGGSAWEEFGSGCIDTFPSNDATNGSISFLNLSGDPANGMRTQIPDFYSGAEILIFGPGTDLNVGFPGQTASTWTKLPGFGGHGEILGYDSLQGNATVFWIIPPKTNQMNCFEFVIFYNNNQVRTQNHRCIIKLQDEYGNIVDNQDSISVVAKILTLDTGSYAQNSKHEALNILIGTRSRPAIGGLVTFPTIRALIPGQYLLRFEVPGSLDIKREVTSLVMGNVVLNISNQPRSQLIIQQQPALNMIAFSDVYAPHVKLADAFGNPFTSSNCLQVTATLNYGSKSILLQIQNASAGGVNFSNLGPFSPGIGMNITFSSGCCGPFGQNVSCTCFDIRERSYTMSELTPSFAPCVTAVTRSFNIVLGTSAIDVSDFPPAFPFKVGVPITLNLILRDNLGLNVKVNQKINISLEIKSCFWAENISLTNCKFTTAYQTNAHVLGREQLTVPALTTSTGGDPLNHSLGCDADMSGPVDSILSSANSPSSKIPFFCSYTLIVSLTADPSISWVSSSFIVLPDVHDHLKVLRSPSSVQVAGIAFTPAPLVQLMDRFENPVYDNGVEIVVKRTLGSWVGYRQSICKNQVCDNDPSNSGSITMLGPNSLGCASNNPSDRTAGCCQDCSCNCCCRDINRPDLFCRNIQDNDKSAYTRNSRTLDSCFHACELDPNCVGVTYFKDFKDWSTFAFDNSPRYNCFKVYSHCIVATSPLADSSVYLFGFLQGDLSVNTISGSSQFLLKSSTAGNYTISFCLASDRSCDSPASTNTFKVLGAEIIDIEVLRPNFIEGQLGSVEMNAPSSVSSNFILEEPFTVTVRVRDIFDNTATDYSNFAVYVAVATGSHPAILLGNLSAWIFDGFAIFTDLIIIGNEGQYTLTFSAQISDSSNRYSPMTSSFKVIKGEMLVNLANAVRAIEVSDFEELKLFGGEPFPRIVNVAVLDSAGKLAILSKLSVEVYSPVFQGAGSCSDPVNQNFQLIGRTSQMIENGMAIFTDLGVGAVNVSVLSVNAMMLCFVVKNTTGHIRAGPIKMFTGPVCFPGAMHLSLINQPSQDPLLGLIKFFAGVAIPNIALEISNYPTGYGGWPARGRESICSNENANGLLRSRREVYAKLTNVSACNHFSRKCLHEQGGTLLGSRKAIADLGQPSVVIFTDLVINIAGNYMLEFISEVPGGINLSTSFTFRVIASKENLLPTIYLQPSAGISSLSLSATILVFEDMYGNVVENVSTSVEARISKNTATVAVNCWNYRSVFEYPQSQRRPSALCGQLVNQVDPQDRIGSVTVKAVGGVAVFNCLSIDKVGLGYTLIFSQGPETAPLTIIAGKPFGVRVLVQPATSMLAGVRFYEFQTPVLELHDRMYNGISSSIRNSSAFAFVAEELAQDLNLASWNCHYLCIETWPPKLEGSVLSQVPQGRVYFPDVYITRATNDLWIQFNVLVNNETFTALSSNFSIEANPSVFGIIVKSNSLDTLQGEVLQPTPSVSLIDEYKNLLTTASYMVIASLIAFPCTGSVARFDLHGITSLMSSGGVVTFTDLSSSAPTGSYCLRFELQLDSNSILQELRVINISNQFRIISKPLFFRIAPDSWEVCSRIVSNVSCSEYCTWSPGYSKCLGLQDASAGSALVQQPRVILLDMNGKPVAATGYVINISLQEGIAGFFLSGAALQRCLNGTLSVKTLKGIAQFSDLKMLCEGQGYRLKFSIDERIGLPDGVSSAFGVYGEPFHLNVITQPKDGTANISLSVVRVQVRDIGENIFFGSGQISVALNGIYRSKCPQRSKTLLVSPETVEILWDEYSDGSTMALSSFLLLVQNELNLVSSKANLVSIFHFFDIEGAYTVDGVPIPDGAISKDEFQRATSLCACARGEGAGNFSVDVTGSPVIHKSNFCQPLQECRSDHLGLLCRRARALVPRYLNRLSPLEGITVAPIIGGIAEFTDLIVMDCEGGLSLTFQFFGVTTKSEKFSVSPGFPSGAVFLSPLQYSTYMAGSVLDIRVLVLDAFGNFQPQSTGFLTLHHSNMSAFSSECLLTSQILPCDSCLDGDNQCPGATCPFRCDYSNFLNMTAVDHGPLGPQVCAYRCKTGCSFICGTMSQIDVFEGISVFKDIKIKRTGIHSLTVSIDFLTVDISYKIDWSSWRNRQLQILRNLLLVPLDYDPAKPQVSFDLEPAKPFFLVSDFREYLQQSNIQENKAGAEILPYPTCMITDLYGNLVLNSQRRVGLFIRDSDRDDFDLDSARKKFRSDIFTPLPSSSLQFTVDDTGCAAVGESEIGVCPAKDDSVRALLDRPRTISYDWCPSDSETRFCRSCRTANRDFDAYNQTFWKQTYEYVNDALGLQVQGAFDCPARKVCNVDNNGDATACGCLVFLRNATGEQEFDVCDACSTRSLPFGLPVSYTSGGIARFRNITCRKPRKGYRFYCMSPPEGDNTEILSSISLDIKTVRKPPKSFVQDSSWGQFISRKQLLWRDESGNEHPKAQFCNATCVNHTFEAAKDYSDIQKDFYTAEVEYQKNHCPAECWKYGYPVSRNPIFNYVAAESPGLSFPFSIVVGDVTRVLVEYPEAASIVATEDTLLPNHLPITSFFPFCGDNNGSRACGLPTFHLVDRFNHVNLTNEGIGVVSLIPGPFSYGSELAGVTKAAVQSGQVTFMNLKINCIALGNRLRFRYLPWPNITIDSTYYDVIGDSLPFDVLPAPPRLSAVILDASWTRIQFFFDRMTDTGNAADSFDCSQLIQTIFVASNTTPNLNSSTDSVLSWKNVFGLNFFCSWINRTTLVLQSGWNASFSLSDRILLKDWPIRTIRRFPDPFYGKILTSLPITSSTEENVEGQSLAVGASRDTPKDSCTHSLCAPKSILVGDKLERTFWSCTNSVPLISKSLRCSSDISGSNVQDLAFFKILEVPFLAVANFCEGKASCDTYDLARAVVIYEMADSISVNGKSRGFYELQSLRAAGAIDVEGYQIYNDKASAVAYIAIAQYFDGGTYKKSVDIYEYHKLSSTFQLLQKIPSNGARKVKADFFSTDNYLFIAQEYDNSILMKWIPGSFVFESSSSSWSPGIYRNVVSFLTAGASNLKTTWIGASWILAFTNFRSRNESSSEGTQIQARSTVDIFTSGIVTEISSFSVAQDEESAVVTLRNVNDVALNYLTFGAVVTLNNESMKIMGGDKETGSFTVSLAAICLDGLGNPCTTKSKCSCVSGPRSQQVCSNSSFCRMNGFGSSIYIGPEYVLSGRASPSFQLPSTGATDLEFMSLNGSEYVIVANQFSGCSSSGYECDSMIYHVNYSTKVFTRYHRILTKGASGLLLIRKTISNAYDSTETTLYLFVANLRSSSSYHTESTLFRWVNSAASDDTNYNCSDRLCAFSPSIKTGNGHFESTAQFSSSGGVQWLYAEPSPDEVYLILVSSRSDFSLKSQIQTFKFSPSNPLPVPLIISPLGTVRKHVQP